MPRKTALTPAERAAQRIRLGHTKQFRKYKDSTEVALVLSQKQEQQQEQQQEQEQQEQEQEQEQETREACIRRYLDDPEFRKDLDEFGADLACRLRWVVYHEATYVRCSQLWCCCVKGDPDCDKTKQHIMIHERERREIRFRMEMEAHWSRREQDPQAKAQACHAVLRCG